jgi:Tol biopolymer transport system component
VPTPGFTDFSQASWMPDGNSILFAGQRKEEGLRLWVVPVKGGAPRPVSPEGIEYELGQHSVHPDGSVVAALQGGSLFLFPIGGGQPKPIRGLFPRHRLMRFSKDGKFLYVCRSGASTAEIVKLEIDTGRLILVRKISLPDPAGFTSLYANQITDDEKSYFFSAVNNMSDLYLAERLT